MIQPLSVTSFFFFTHPPTTEIYTLSLHDALPIWFGRDRKQETLDAFLGQELSPFQRLRVQAVCVDMWPAFTRSEEHTSELQSRGHLVCRLLLEKKKIKQTHHQLSPLHIIKLHIVL